MFFLHFVNFVSLLFTSYRVSWVWQLLLKNFTTILWWT